MYYLEKSFSIKFIILFTLFLATMRADGELQKSGVSVINPKELISVKKRLGVGNQEVATSKFQKKKITQSGMINSFYKCQINLFLKYFVNFFIYLYRNLHLSVFSYIKCSS